MVQSYKKVEKNAKENRFFFSFPSVSNFGEAKVTKLFLVLQVFPSFFLPIFSKKRLKVIAI